MTTDSRTQATLLRREREEKAAKCDRLIALVRRYLGGTQMIYLNDIEQANEYLRAATFQCIFRTNGCCWSKCGCRPYCEPDKNGLETVEHWGRVDEL